MFNFIFFFVFVSVFRRYRPSDPRYTNSGGCTRSAWLDIMITQDTSCGEAHVLMTSVELSEQMRTRIRQVARQLQTIGDKLENRYFRPLPDAGQNHDRLGLNFIEVARAIFLRYVTELFGRNNWIYIELWTMYSTLCVDIRDNSIIG